MRRTTTGPTATGQSHREWVLFFRPILSVIYARCSLRPIFKFPRVPRPRAPPLLARYYFRITSKGIFTGSWQGSFPGRDSLARGRNEVLESVIESAEFCNFRQKVFSSFFLLINFFHLSFSSFFFKFIDSSRLFVRPIAMSNYQLVE